jgi:signal transduction histidine kinase
MQSSPSVKGEPRSARPVLVKPTPRHFRPAARTPVRCANDRAAPSAESRLNAMSAMASTLAHELSQPITATRNYLEVCSIRLRRQIGGLEELLAAVEDANAQARKAGEIIGRMRDFMLSGTISGQRQDLRHLFTTASKSLSGREQVEIVAAFASDAVEVIADRVLIGQVLSNILTNAVEALAGCDARQITIGSERQGSMVLVRIADTGPGLSDDAIARLFEPFFTTKPTGTGLGMPLCRTIVEALGGRLWAEPNPEGAMLCFTLPAAEA